MNQYGKVALKAVELFKSNKEKSPRKAWQKAAEGLLEKESLINKVCPRSAFLGLCEEELIKGIPSGDYTSSKKNKSYAIEATKILKNNKFRESLTSDELWEKVKNKININIAHNSQMDVILSLYKEQLFY